MDFKPKPKHVTLHEHPDVSIRKEKIFSELDLKNRRTKIVCTIGYVFYFL